MKKLNSLFQDEKVQEYVMLAVGIAIIAAITLLT